MDNFSHSALENLSKIIGDKYTGSEITEFFHKIGYNDIQHDGTTKWRFVYDRLKDIQNTNGYFAIAKVIEQLCSPEEFIQDKDGFSRLLEQVNEILSYYKLRVNDNGKIIKDSSIEPKLQSKVTEDAKLFNSRHYHPEIKKHAFKLFNEGRYFHAVFECCKAFDKYVSEKADTDKHGSKLMTEALSLKGCLKLNAQQTETERNEQQGLMHLCAGLMSAIRNPQGHEPELHWKMTREDALDVLSLMSYLYRQIESTVVFQKGDI
ncbi:TIGR02391 family protein [Methanococcoides methylutens]|uniref:TIGR02391 family protein n=1 Tax=Methanococcoides methylutens TaxID=2226 RepID=UPI000693F820|nr:TIGR02391 family protein [Methanococcoides methylutens]